MTERVDTVDYVNKVKMGKMNGMGRIRKGFSGMIWGVVGPDKATAPLAFNCPLMFIVACKFASSLAAFPFVSAATLFHPSTVKRLYDIDMNVIPTLPSANAFVCTSLV